jgi:hypothetical protein
LGGTILTHYLRQRPNAELERIRKETLRKRFAAVAKEYDWLPMATLSDCIGADRPTTVRLLLLIGARRSMLEKDVWGLKEWPEPSN